MVINAGWTTNAVAQVTPLRRSIGYRQILYREGAKQRSFAKSDE